MISNEFAAVKGRGTHRCSMVVRNDLQHDWQHTWYCLKIDVSRFFDNIDRDILFEMLKHKIKDYYTLEILHTIIFDVPGTRGLPIGLFSSQILSVFYLSQLDHYCKETLGIRHYYRYMDDIVILASNKNLLHNYLRLTNRQLGTIGLSIKKNYAIFPIEKRRLDFVGFVFNHTSVAVRKRTVLSYKRSCNLIVNSLAHHEPITTHMLSSKISYEGIIIWASSDDLINIYSGKVDIALEFGVEAICNTGKTLQQQSGSPMWRSTTNPSMCAGAS